MTTQRDEKPGEHFDDYLDYLMHLLLKTQNPFSSTTVTQRTKNVSYFLAYVLKGLDDRLTDAESRLKILEEGNALIVGWDAIAAVVGVSKRTLQRKKEELLRDEVIHEEYIGDPRRKRIVASASALSIYKRKKSSKT